MARNHDHEEPLDLLQIARLTMLEAGFNPDIPPAVAKEVQQLRPDSPDSTSERDLRGLLWSSIDNADSRDLDQVEFVEEMDDGKIRVLIGVADVDASAPEGSAIDAHAAENKTTVYTGVKTFPMLPLELSTDRTSLVEAEDRLAIIIEFVVASDGSATTRDVYAGTVRNHAKLAYDEIGRWLDDNGPTPSSVSGQLEQQLRLQLEAANRLGELRKQHGALELETIEATPVIDDKGLVTDLAISERNSARAIIENFMITANVAIAEFLDKNGVTSLRRVVRTPENWSRIVEIARELGEDLTQTPDARALADFLAKRRKIDPTHFPDLSLAVIKLLGPGEYVVQNPGETGEGHFGLAVHSYTHSTAPNRRYADLITQRLLKSARNKDEAPYTSGELRTIADQCTERENMARKVERKMRKVAAAMFFRNRIGEQFRAIVTGITPKGTFVRVIKPPVDGLVVKGKEGLKVGQQVEVRLLATDPAKGFIDFAVLHRNSGKTINQHGTHVNQT